MKNFYFLLLFIFSNSIHAQYPFEKYPVIKTQKLDNWKTIEFEDKVENIITISEFSNINSLILKTTSYYSDWFTNSKIQIYSENKEIQSFNVDMAFPPIAINPIFVLDINNDGLKDIKIISYYMGNGLASLNVKVFYLLQKPNKNFVCISYDEKEGSHQIERDIDGDGKFEIISMNSRSYKNHTYWVFNLYNFEDFNLVNVNKKLNYPILIQFLHRENFKITDRVSRKEMMKFDMKLPDKFIKQ